MNSEKLRTFVEVFGIAAVVVSLVLLTIEIRDNTRAMKASTRQEMAAQDLSYIAVGLDSSVLAVAFAKFQAEEALTNLEEVQLVQHQHLNYRIFENAYYQHAIGVLDDSTWERYAHLARYVICTNPLAKRMWNANRWGFSVGFRDHVDAEIESCPRYQLLWGEE